MPETEQIDDWEETGGADNALAGAKPALPVDPAGTATPALAADEADAASLESHEDAHGRHRRARSQRAGPDDVPRIKQLTARLREAEKELAAVKGGIAPATPAAPKPPGTPPAPAAAAAPVEVTVPRGTSDSVPWPGLKPAKDDPEPKADDFEDFAQFVKAQARWETRQEMREANDRAVAAQKEHAVKGETARLASQWKAATAAAEAKYPDFKEVAYAPTAIPQGSMIDAWILEHRAGAEILYHLQKNPAEVPRLLGLSMLEQVEELSLLAQRLAPTRQADVKTGASAAQVVAQPVPRPPTPVRTGPMRTGDELPGDDDSLEAHERAFYRDNRRRRA